MKKYLLIGPGIVAGISERHAVDIKNAIDWVEDPKKATADYEPAAKETQDRLTAIGIETELEEITSDKHQSKWVICKED
jgi:hypothetical protein